MRPLLLVCVIIGMAASAGCLVTHGPSGASPAMKGYELYSWPAGQDWDFALLPGTNRLKTLDQIKSSVPTLHGLEAVKTVLTNLPVGEHVFWMGGNWLRQAQADPGDIAIPPAPVRDQITGFCSQRGIALTVND